MKIILDAVNPEQPFESGPNLSRLCLATRGNVFAPEKSEKSRRHYDIRKTFFDEKSQKTTLGVTPHVFSSARDDRWLYDYMTIWHGYDWYVSPCNWGFENFWIASWPKAGGLQVKKWLKTSFLVLFQPSWAPPNSTNYQRWHRGKAPYYLCKFTSQLL